MQVDRIFDNRQSKSGARNFPYIAGPVKRLKEMRDLVRGNANTLVYKGCWVSASSAISWQTLRRSIC